MLITIFNMKYLVEIDYMSDFSVFHRYYESNIIVPE